MIVVPIIRNLAVAGILGVAFLAVTGEHATAQSCPRKVSPDKNWTQEDCEQCCRDTASGWYSQCVRKIPCSKFPRSKGKSGNLIEPEIFSRPIGIPL